MHKSDILCAHYTFNQDLESHNQLKANEVCTSLHHYLKMRLRNIRCLFSDMRRGLNIVAPSGTSFISRKADLGAIDQLKISDQLTKEKKKKKKKLEKVTCNMCL